MYVGLDPVNRTDPTGMQTVFEVQQRHRDLGPSVADRQNREAAERAENGIRETIQSARDDPLSAFIMLFGAAVDIADTVVSPGPDAVLGAAVISGARGAAARNAGEAAANWAANIERGIPESQLGPSGQPRIHTNQHSSRKAAREAAERRAPAGGRVRNDARPANPDQGPHFQPENPDGTNVHPNVHEEYPRE